MASDGKGAPGPPEVMRRGGRWYAAYPLRPRHVEARMEDRGVEGEHSSINRWGIQDSPPRDAACPRRTPPVGGSGRREATSSKVQGQWRARSRALDKPGQPRDVRLMAHRATAAARRCLPPARRRHGLPETLPIAGSAANEAASQSAHEAHGPHRLIRQGPYCNNSVAQEQRGGKRVTRP